MEIRKGVIVIKTYEDLLAVGEDESKRIEFVKEVIAQHKDGHRQLAQILMDREVIFAEDVEKIFGKRPWTSRTDEIIAANATARLNNNKQRTIKENKI